MASWQTDLAPSNILRACSTGIFSTGQPRIAMAGGHTIDSNDPIFGLAVTGTATIKNLKQNNTAQEGDQIFLTKPVGVGVLSTPLNRFH